MNSSGEIPSSTVIMATPIASVIPSGMKEFIPPCNEEIKPRENQIFSTLKVGEAYYKNYAKECGFEIRLGTTKRQKRGNHGEFQLRDVLCNRAGFREVQKKIVVHVLTDDNRPSVLNRRRFITRVGCKARIQFTQQIDETYMVNKFYEGHNHVTTSPDSMLFLKGNKNMTSVQKNFVAKAARLKLGGVKAFRGWKELSGGYNNVGASENDFKNFVRDMKKYIGDFDGQMFIENFMRKKEMCKTFFFDFQVDENDRLCRVFWADTISIKNFLLFGDMTSVDSTYRTNKYNMVFVPFTGVDHHKGSINLGAGLLAHEDIDSFKWLFSCFLEAMGGCQPKVLITDQDPAMKIAIAEVFPETSHRLCMWHIMKKLREKVDAYLWQDEEFKKRLNCCVWSNNLDSIEFEEMWSNIMIDYDLVDYPWFCILFDIREEWIHAYFKEIFKGGLMRVTSISESENNFFDRFVTPHVSLVDFWMCYESAMECQRHKQHKLNHYNKHSQPPLKTPLLLEKHAAELYTHNIFKEFQKELCATLYSCGMDDLSKTDDTEVYTITDTEREGRTWTVAYTTGSGEATCSCCLYDRMGLLCRHILWLFRTKKAKTIPERYIVSRWTKDAMKKPVFDKHGQVFGECDALNDKKTMTTELWAEVYSCVSLTEENDDDVQKLIDMLKDFGLEITKRQGDRKTIQDKQKEMERYVGCSIPTEVNIQAPKRSHNKGGGKRIESQVLNALERNAKKLRYCKSCGGDGHDSRNCKKPSELHIIS